MSNFLYALAGGLQGALQKKQRNEAELWKRKVYSDTLNQRNADIFRDERRYQEGLALRQQEQAESRRMQGVSLALRELEQTTDRDQAGALVDYINTNGQGIVPPKDKAREMAAAQSRGYLGVVKSLPAFREVGLNAEQVRTALPAANQFIPRPAPPVSQPMVSPQPVQQPVPAMPDPSIPLPLQLTPAFTQPPQPAPYQPPVDQLDSLLNYQPPQTEADKVKQMLQFIDMVENFKLSGLSQEGYDALGRMGAAFGLSPADISALFNQGQVDKVASMTERNLASAAHQNALAKAVPETTRIKLATLANAVRNTSSMIQNREVMAAIAQQRVAVSRELASIARAGLDLKGNQLAADEIDRLLDLAESLYRDATDQSQIAAGAYESGLSGTAREAKEKAATQKLRADTIMSNLGYGTPDAPTVPTGKGKPTIQPKPTPGKGKPTAGGEESAKAELYQMAATSPALQAKIEADRGKGIPYIRILQDAKDFLGKKK